MPRFPLIRTFCCVLLFCVSSSFAFITTRVPQLRLQQLSQRPSCLGMGYGRRSSSRSDSITTMTVDTNNKNPIDFLLPALRKGALRTLLSVVLLAGTPAFADDIDSASTTELLAAPTAAEEQSAATVFDENSARDFVLKVEKVRPLFSDEFVLNFEKESLGLGLTETFYKGFPVVTVTSIKDPTLLQAEGSPLRVGAVVIAVGEENTSGIPLKEITEKVGKAGRPLALKFRDPSRYFELLDSCVGSPKRVITTSYLPANTRDVGAPEQIIRVERLAMPPAEDRRRSSQYLDVMEIQYVAQLPGGDEVVDSSAARSPPGTSAGSIYYILGQRNGPPGKFPPGWDLTLRGMVVGEKRRITLPSTLAYDRVGSKDKKIPPFSGVVYTVRLVSLT